MHLFSFSVTVLLLTYRKYVVKKFLKASKYRELKSVVKNKEVKQ